MPSPTAKHVVVGSGMQPSLPPQQYVNVPVPVSGMSMTMEPNGQRMLLTNAVQSTVAWPQGGTRQVAIVPSWGQHGTAPHSLIVDSAQFYNVEEIYAKQPLSIHKYEKKESPVHHLNVPRHEKKETNQLSPVKKRVKENTPPHNHQYQHQNNSVQLQQNDQRGYNNHRSSYHRHVSPQQPSQINQYHNNSSFYGGSQNQNGHYDANQHYPAAVVVNPNGGGNKQRHQQQNHHQIVNSTITINDTPSPTSVILISDSEDEEDTQNQNYQKNLRSTNNNQNYSTITTTSSTQCNKNDNPIVINNGASSSGQQCQQRKNVISCVTVGDSDGEESTNKQNQLNYQHPQNVKYESQGHHKKRNAYKQQQAQQPFQQQYPNILLGFPPSSSTNQLKQEPAEFASALLNQFEYPPYDHQKRASWVGPTSSIVQPPLAHTQNHHLNNKRDSTGSNPGPQQQPLGNSPIGASALLQSQQADMYAQAELYRRPSVFVSQASYAYNTPRVVPPPAHNGNSRQVRSGTSYAGAGIFLILFIFRYSQHSPCRLISNFRSTDSLEPL